MIKYLRNNVGIPAVNGFIPYGMPSFSNFKGFDYNPKKAKQFKQSYSINGKALELKSNPLIAFFFGLMLVLDLIYVIGPGGCFTYFGGGRPNDAVALPRYEAEAACLDKLYDRGSVRC